VLALRAQRLSGGTIAHRAGLPLATVGNVLRATMGKAAFPG
jgi:hypothetical protein